MDDFLSVLDDLGIYNPLNNNSMTVYILFAFILLFLFLIPEKSKIISTKGVVISSLVFTFIVVCHQVPFIREHIPYF